ncbi:uncharacterized protein LOC120627947 [Pararge aegeria]|uniref:uncharacterized protein LOC120627947 n=1 Tax=Pararge aegeria TaxID=116150 RepID=UPI0019D27509|nr:uncharacterized protein LOC120627947 [Pararge aegeria]
MLGDRIEEYKTTSKKRRIEKGNSAPKAKNAKLTRQYQTESSIKKQNGIHMYASTPVQTPTTVTKQLSMLPAMLSCINKLSPRMLNINARKLVFDDTDESADMNERSKMEESPASFSSISKINLPETLEKRRLQKAHVKARRLFADEDDQDNGECMSKDLNSNEEHNTVKCLSNDCNEKNLNQCLSPLRTPKRLSKSRKTMNARNLTFDDENEDTSAVKNLSSERPSDGKLGQMNSPIELYRRFLKDQDLIDLSTCPEATLIPEESTDYSPMMVLSVGIFIRPIRDDREGK